MDVADPNCDNARVDRARCLLCAVVDASIAAVRPADMAAFYRRRDVRDLPRCTRGLHALTVARS